jgi:hypothetical protein
MKFLIELNVFPENEQNFADVLTDLKVDHCFWDGESNPPYDKNDNKVFFIGNIHTALKIKQLGYRYQVWLDEKFDYSYFGAHLNNLLNDPFYLITHAQAYDAAKKLIGPERTQQDFTRSNSGYKRFQGDLYSADTYLVEAERQAIPREEIMVFADKKEIAQEYRFVIRCKLDEISDLWDYEIVTYSQYSENEVRELTYEQIKGIISDLQTSNYHPFPMFVLDLGFNNNELKIIEANSINTSGYYACDFSKIVKNILEISKTEII